MAREQLENKLFPTEVTVVHEIIQEWRWEARSSSRERMEKTLPGDPLI